LQQQKILIVTVEQTYIRISHHFVREAVLGIVIGVTHCESKNMLADILTKYLSRTRIVKLRNLVRLMSK